MGLCFVDLYFSGVPTLAKIQWLFVDKQNTRNPRKFEPHGNYQPYGKYPVMWSAIAYNSLQYGKWPSCAITYCYLIIWGGKPSWLHIICSWRRPTAQAISLERFNGYQLIRKLFPPWMICNLWYCCMFSVILQPIKPWTYGTGGKEGSFLPKCRFAPWVRPQWWS